MYAIALFALMSDPIPVPQFEPTAAKVGSSWEITIDGVTHRVPTTVNRGDAIRAAAMAARPKPNPLVEGLVLTVMPNGNSGTITASSRGVVAPPVYVVYSDGTQPLNWSPLPVERAETRRAPTTAERFIRTNPASSTPTINDKPVCVT